MNNTQIIMMERVRLMEEGILDSTGDTFYIESDDGNQKEIKMPEEIHTYAAWKELGYQVRKGEKAVASFMIWKYKAGKTEAENPEEQPDGKMFMKKAHFFKMAQVDRI